MFKKQYNDYDFCGDLCIGYTHNKNEPFYFDFDDYDKVKNYCWSSRYQHGNYYSISSDHTKIWNVIMDIDPRTSDYICDHIDHNPYNNCKSNLRLVTKEQNAKNRALSRNNTSGVTGVSFHKRENVWSVSISEKYIGQFKNKEDAIRCRLQAEKDLYGEYAPQRNLFEKYNIT